MTRLLTTAIRNVHVKTVIRLSEAIAELRTGGYHIAILDLGLEDSDGIITLSTIKKLYPDLPLLVITGKEGDLLAEEIAKAGAMGYLAKPISDSAILINEVKNTISRQQVQKDLIDRLQTCTARLEANNDKIRSYDNLTNKIGSD